MKKIITSLFFVGAMTFTGNAQATPVSLDVAGGPSSMVAVTENNNLFSFTTTLTADLYTGLDAYNFTLRDNQSKEINFFTLTAAGFGIDTYTIMATLAFDSPQISGSGGGIFGTFLGKISGGILNWDTQPADITLNDGNVISILFENGLSIGCGDTAMVHATITNNGGDIFPVPEPATMLLMGTGLAGIFGIARGKIIRSA
ncbi:MAG: PEP-CTERM sorting domain-containing protein [Proteobacteria bacterium]|nr:PEP-CTERM sorting domain-containing protein [Pseudomonadota bacterium]MBU4296174.1 PEP-CTERM sorting domain-containing protein [Pseudomonadota bacterium]MCG2749636.1 PEP-CTERM sorting domain-containing protein [Desulfobulbaceae bacterium]